MGNREKGKAVKKICDKMGWAVKAFVDNDESKLGNLEGIPVIAQFNVYSRYDYGVYDAVNEFAVNNGYEFI